MARKAALAVRATATATLVRPLAELSTRVCWIVVRMEGASTLLGSLI